VLVFAAGHTGGVPLFARKNKAVSGNARILRSCATALGLVLPLGCDRQSAPAQPLATPASADAAARLDHHAIALEDGAAKLQFRSQVIDGYLVVRVVNDRGQDGVAVRRTRVDSDPPDPVAIAAQERIAARPWLAAGRRAATLADADALQEHDGWIETVERLQEGLRHDPTHLGMLRDLLTADVELLSFEAGSPLGLRVCEMTAATATQFEAAAGPGDLADRQLIAQARRHVFFSMKLYPCLRDPSATTDESAIWKALGAPAEYLDLETFAVGRFTVNEQRVVDPCPTDGMLWDELFFVISSGASRLPENTTAYVLSRRGPRDGARYYLFFRSIRGERIVSVFGRESPDARSLRNMVERSVATATQQLAESKP
jgi:hypothetical protein